MLQRGTALAWRVAVAVGPQTAEVEAEEDDVDDVRRAGENVSNSNGNRAGYAEWIAVGAVVAGSVGAIVGAKRCSRRGAHHHAVEPSARPDSATLTAPHGDKLAPLL